MLPQRDDEDEVEDGRSPNNNYQDLEEEQETIGSTDELDSSKNRKVGTNRS